MILLAVQALQYLLTQGLLPLNGEFINFNFVILRCCS